MECFDYIIKSTKRRIKDVKENWDGRTGPSSREEKKRENPKSSLKTSTA